MPGASSGPRSAISCWCVGWVSPDSSVARLCKMAAVPARGKQVYEAACAACHGADLMGVANIPNMPAGAELRLIGGRGTLTSQKAVATVESYWPYATTLFDYIRRAMPFTAPGSLSADEVYAVCAYILGKAKIIDKTAVLDAQTLPRVEMPNRDGFISDPRPEIFK